MQNRTIIQIDVIVMMGASIILALLTAISIGSEEIFMAHNWMNVRFIVGVFWILPFAISALLATFEHTLSAKIAMLVGFVIFAYVLSLALTHISSTSIRNY